MRSRLAHWSRQLFGSSICVPPWTPLLGTDGCTESAVLGDCWEDNVIRLFAKIEAKR